MNRELAIWHLNDFIKEMECTLASKNKKDRAYAPEVFWKNKYTLEEILEWLKDRKEAMPEWQEKNS